MVRASVLYTNIVDAKFSCARSLIETHEKAQWWTHSIQMCNGDTEKVRPFVVQ